MWACATGTFEGHGKNVSHKAPSSCGITENCVCLQGRLRQVVAGKSRQVPFISRYQCTVLGINALVLSSMDDRDLELTVPEAGVLA